MQPKIIKERKKEREGERERERKERKKKGKKERRKERKRSFQDLDIVISGDTLATVISN